MQNEGKTDLIYRFDRPKSVLEQDFTEVTFPAREILLCLAAPRADRHQFHPALLGNSTLREQIDINSFLLYSTVPHSLSRWTLISFCLTQIQDRNRFTWNPKWTVSPLRSLKLNTLILSLNGSTWELPFPQGSSNSNTNGSKRLKESSGYPIYHTFLQKPHRFFKCSTLLVAYKYTHQPEEGNKLSTSALLSKHSLSTLHTNSDLGIRGVLVDTTPVSSTLFCRSSTKHARKRLIKTHLRNNGNDQ